MTASAKTDNLTSASARANSRKARSTPSKPASKAARQAALLVVAPTATLGGPRAVLTREAMGFERTVSRISV
ncbi:uncharacterized protein A1O9_06994 [Exophiala aquamarina CBS 119918]|uniref:Uncharacterized protein n=1 Tax=Exophiala aquamarina CBS 119918 TaxID=1182545 RepID=A0A072P9P1_9EURO|nr:uncharacterized protein A1O9_06994 [Exophiala aquamarina CBS 119918]KEF56804.1 hypothetical protein A1O9_06994 [Exophiala aquamarina CBS 119918]